MVSGAYGITAGKEKLKNDIFIISLFAEDRPFVASAKSNRAGNLVISDKHRKK